MKTEAAVLVAPGRPLELAELAVPALKPGQVLVQVAFSGVCHTQVLEARGYRGEDKYLPHCLGHEGSGTVVQIGAGVTKVKADDLVVLSWIKGAGMDVPGSVYDWDGRPVNAGGITTFQRLTVVAENRLTPLPEGLSLRDAALLGCAIPTGMGAVFNTAQPRPGQSVAVFGIGGVGLCAVAAAHIAGCVPVIAVDLQAHKLPLAQRMGATHVINASEQEAASSVRALCPEGVDVAIEATGRPAVMELALESVRMQGGVAVVIGNAPFGESVTLDPRQLNLGKRLLGTWGGDNWPDRDYPRYAKLITAGRLDLGPFEGAAYRLRDINVALHDLEAGRVARPMIDMSLQ